MSRAGGWPPPSSKAAQFRDGVARGDLDYLPIWQGEAVDLITERDSASALVRRISDEATRAIAAVRTEPPPAEQLWQESQSFRAAGTEWKTVEQAPCARVASRLTRWMR